MASVSRAARLRLVADGPLFRGFAAGELERLVDQLVERRFSAGQMVFARGEPGSHLFVVAQGRVRLSMVSAQGREALIALLGPGEVFGELALLDGGARSMDATAAKDCVLLALDRRAFLALLETAPEVRWHLLRLLCERLRDANDRLERTLFLPVAARLARLLVTLAEHDREGRVAALSQADLGRLIGASRERVSLQLSSWRAAGLLARDGRALVIRDRGRLLALAGACEA